MRRRGGTYARRRTAAVAVLSVSVVLFAAAVFCWSRARPAAIDLSAKPADSVIRFGALRPVSGHLSRAGVKAGTYRLVVSRRGFRTHAERIRLVPGESAGRKVALVPLRLPLTVRTQPADVRIEVRREGRLAGSGKAPLTTRIPAGGLEVTLWRRGYNKITERFFFDTARKIELWMDPKGLLHRSLRFFACGPSPKQVAFSPNGAELWVSTMGTTGVEIYNPLTGRRVGRVGMGPNGAVEVVFTRDGKRVYASQMQTASVFAIEARTRRLGRQFPTNSAWTKVMALSPDEKTLFAANWSGNDVSEIDLGRGRVRRRLPTVKTPRGLYVTADGKRLFIAGFDDGEIQRISLATGKSKILIRTGGAMRHLVADEKKGLLYADDMALDRIYVVNLKTERVRMLARTDEKPNTIDLTPDGKVLYVSCRGENGPSYYVPGPEWGSVLAIDTATGRVLDAIVGGNQCTGLDVSPDGRLLAFSDFLDGRIRVYRIPTYATLAAGRGGRAKAHLADIRK